MFGRFKASPVKLIGIRHMEFYSARLLHIILVDDGKPRKRNRYNETVVVFKARDYEHAFARALELGRASETTYENGAGQPVRWAFVEVTNLDHLGRKIDGIEVASHLHTRVSREPIAPRVQFAPEQSEPSESF